MKLENFLINQNENLENAIKKISLNNQRTLFVINYKKKLIGSITDGDLRSLLLRSDTKKNLQVKKLMNKKPLYFFLGEYNKEKERKILKENIKIIPIVNKKLQILKVIQSESVRKIFLSEIPLLIVAGGLGKRLRPITNKSPKPMVKINGKPILEYIINDAREQGIEKIIISIGYLGKKIEKYFQNGKKFGVSIKYISENKPLGTAGFLGKLKNKKMKTLLITNGDVMSRIDYFSLLNFHNQKRSNATMAVKEYQIQSKFGVVKDLKNKFIKVEEKPTFKYLINAGQYVLGKNVFKYVKNGENIDMPNFFMRLKKLKKKIFIYAFSNDWSDIANVKDLDNFKRNFEKFYE